MEKLKGKVALVTGSARGIGAAIAERLANDGATVVINDLKAEGDAELVAKRIHDAGGNAIVLPADVGVWDQATWLVQETAKQLGRFDILVNNAAIIDLQPFGEINQSELRSQFAVNVEGPIATALAAVPLFPEEGGRIINISSLGATYPSFGTAAYSASKGAIEAFMRVAALELGSKGITVNVVSPGSTATEAFKEKAPEDYIKVLIERTPLRRIGEPSDIADVVAFLASSDGRWITGQVLLASGGFIP